MPEQRTSSRLKNRGATSLRCKMRREDPMREFDRLRPELRAWLSTAMLPWRARSVKRAFEKALTRTGDIARALEELDRLQERRVASDSPAVWGEDYPGPVGR